MWTRAVWIEEGEEIEGTIPKNWIINDHVYWPNHMNVKRAFKEMHTPTKDWHRFVLIKIKINSGKIFINIQLELLKIY